MLEIVKNLRRTQQGLGRDTAPVQADTAEVVPFDDCGLEAKLRRPDSRNITARPGADDENVKIRVSDSLARLPDPIECNPDWACNACLYPWGKGNDQNRWRTRHPSDLFVGASRLRRRDQGLQHDRGQERAGGIGIKI